MSQKLNFAIYGCGFIAGIHREAIENTDGAVLVGCADAVNECAVRFAREHGIKLFGSLDEILNSPEVDVVSICTPNGTHADIAVKAIEHGKHVVVEKPMATTAEDCERIMQVLDGAGTKLAVISQLRTSEDIVRAKDIIDSGKLGKLILCDLYMKYYRSPEYYRGSWKGTKSMDGGGALMNQGVHGVDLLTYLVGMPKNVKSMVRTLRHDIEVEDTAVALLEFEHGALGVIEATTSVTPGQSRRLEIHGERGSMIISENAIISLIIDGKEQITAPVCQIQRGTNDPGTIDYREHQKQYANLIDSVYNGTPLLVGAYSGSRAVHVIEEIYKCGSTSC